MISGPTHLERFVAESMSLWPELRGVRDARLDCRPVMADDGWEFRVSGRVGGVTSCGVFTLPASTMRAASTDQVIDLLERRARQVVRAAFAQFPPFRIGTRSPKRLQARKP